MARKAAIRIGISGSADPSWRGKFYTEDLRQKDELRFAARAFPSIEINGTFYSTQRPANFPVSRRGTVRCRMISYFQ